MTTTTDHENGAETRPGLLPMPAPPRQFALVLDENDLDYEHYVDFMAPTSRVLWWGTALDGDVLLYSFGRQGGLSTAHCDSVESATRMMMHAAPCKLVWL